MPVRTILKERESKPLVEQLKKIPGLNELSHKSRVEIQTVKDSEVIIIDGEPVAVKTLGRLIPALVNSKVLQNMPHIVVDMGAVPHVAGGADVMAPGIRKIQGKFGENDLVVVVDEKYGKFLAVGSSTLTSEALSTTRKGKVIVNLHYVGDSIWAAIKS
jgi:PUA domain protein